MDACLGKVDEAMTFTTFLAVQDGGIVYSMRLRTGVT